MTDRDIERWTAEWRAGAPPVADLARLARRESQVRSAHGSRSTGSSAPDFWLSPTWLWFDDGSTVMRFAAAGIAVLTVVALAFSVINWRGSFASNRASATDFLALCPRAQPREAALHPLRWLVAGRRCRRHCGCCRA